jgi:hypothetical protein
VNILAIPVLAGFIAPLSMLPAIRANLATS